MAEKIIELRLHHFIARKQGAYLKDLKENLSAEECILLCDFAENYNSIVQDEIQSFYWSSVQSSLHTTVIYLKCDGKLVHEKICVISDCLLKNSFTVNIFLKKSIELLLVKYPWIKKVHYFTDGSAAQYKNKFNLSNLCFHELEKKLKCEWNFFATSHGKSPCDGLGGTVKRLARLASLQNPLSPLITPMDLFDWAKEHVTGINFIFTNEHEVKQEEKILEKRFNSTMAIPGTKTFHNFAPINNYQLKTSIISNDSTFNIVQVILMYYILIYDIIM